jgi:hypothetical protein
MLRSLALAAGLTGTMVLVGAVGFRVTEGLGWLAGALNSVLVITGNGPAQVPRTTAGRIFAMVFAVLGVMVFVSVLGLLLAPVFHRVLHHFHADPVPPAREPGEAETPSPKERAE